MYDQTIMAAYTFARGPMLWAAVLILCAGVVYRTVELYRLTSRKEKRSLPATVSATLPTLTPEERTLDRLARIQQSAFAVHPVMFFVSILFHACLFATPLLALGHSLEIYRTWGITPPSLPEPLIDIMTAIVLVCGLFFLMRRLVLPRVQAISGMADYVLLACVMTPFLTGFCAYHQWFDYTTVITLHLLAGNVLLIALPFTKIGHMVFFFFVRLYISSEFGPARGRRDWKA
jgi:nitrate reductase gamma subunit